VLRIVAPHFVAGISVEWNGRRVAPIIEYMKYWGYDEIVNYCRRKGWRVQVFTEGGRGWCNVV